MNPFDLPGPQFLGFYVCMFVLALALASVLRWYLRLPSDERFHVAKPLGPYETAYLAGGPDRAFEAAVVRLIHEEILHVDIGGRALVRKSDGLPADAAKLEQAIFSSVSSGDGIGTKTVRKRADAALETIRKALVELGYLVDEAQGTLAMLVPLFAVLVVPLMGVVKIFLGWSREKPVGFLVILCILSVFVTFVAYARKVTRSRRGDAVLARLRESHAAMEAQVPRRSEVLSGAEMALGVALFGMAIVPTGPLSSFRTMLAPPPPKSGGSSCSSSWGMSSCSSGSSCGGGCGGGGCGGCGG